MPDQNSAAARAIVIFGATGDLALRMLFPSLYFLESENLLSSDWLVVGSARSDFTDATFRRPASRMM